MLILFYIVQFLHWWANFELGIKSATTSTIYNLLIFGSAVCTIGVMLILGADVNKKKHTHEFYTEKISEETQRQKDVRNLAAQKAKEEAKKANRALNAWEKTSWDNFHTLRKGWVLGFGLPFQSLQKNKIIELSDIYFRNDNEVRRACKIKIKNGVPAWKLHIQVGALSLVQI